MGIAIVALTEGFNPRTHEECDFMSVSTALGIASFNPRTHEECDRTEKTMLCRGMRFNPRTHEECDVLVRVNSGEMILFQSTHPRGVRLYIQQKAEYHNAKVVFLR